MKRIRVSFAIFTLLVACSQQVKKSDPQLSSKEADQMLEDALASGNSDSSSALAVAAQLVHDTSNPARVFISFAKPGRNSPMGPVSSVFSVNTLDFLDHSLGINYSSISQVRLFFIDSPGVGERDEVLIVGVIPQGQATVATAAPVAPTPAATSSTPPAAKSTPAQAPATNTAATVATGQFIYYAFRGQGQVNHGVFTATLTGDKDQTINGRLAKPVIKVSSTDIQGDQYNDVISLSVDAEDSSYIGKFSTMKDMATLGH